MNTQPKIAPFMPMLLALVVFMQMLDASILNTALPSMAKDLNESPLHMQSAVISYALTLALFMPLSGYLCDRYGTKQVFFVSLLIFVAGSLLCALAPNLNMLVFGRVVQGMGGAMLSPVPRLILVRAYEKSRLVSMLNYVIMPALIGPIIGPIVGGYLVEWVSWHWIFLINLPIGLLAAYLTQRFLPDFRGENDQLTFDFVGFLLFSSATVGLSLAMEIINRPQMFIFASVLISFALLSLFLYWRHSDRVAAPLYGRDLLQVRTFRIGLSGNLAARLGMGAVPFLLPLLLQVGLGHSATRAGWTLAPIALASIVAKPFIQPLMRRFGYRRLLMMNTWAVSILIASFALVSPDTPFGLLLPQLLILGMCNSIQFTAMNSLTLADLQPHQAGSGSSLMSVNQQLSLGFGVAIGAMILQFFSQATWLKDLQTAFKLTFISVGAMTMIASLIFARLHQKDGEHLIQ